MPNNLHKFIFLGIIVAVALFSRVAYPTFYAISNGSNGISGAGSVAQPPLFVLQPMGTSSAQIADVAQPVVTPVTQPIQPSVVAQQSPSNVVSPSAIIMATTSLSTSVFTQIGVAAAPAIDDHASLIADLQTGSMLYGTNADVRWPLASLSKLMTATVVLDVMDLNARVTVTPAAVAVDPQQTILQAGDVYTVGDLLRVLLLPSSNVAAEALANAMPITSGGAAGRAAFLAAMNARAAAWGMASTHYGDPSGLSSGNQSTARDLLLLAQKIYSDYPQILAITRTPQVTITELGSGRQVLVKSINDFAGRADFIGGKTGYTDEAAGNLFSIFNYDNHPLLVVVLGTEDGVRFTKTLQLYSWFMNNFK